MFSEKEKGKYPLSFWIVIAVVSGLVVFVFLSFLFNIISLLFGFIFKIVIKYWIVLVIILILVIINRIRKRKRLKMIKESRDGFQ